MKSSFGAVLQTTKCPGMTLTVLFFSFFLTTNAIQRIEFLPRELQVLEGTAINKLVLFMYKSILHSVYAVSGIC